MDSVFLAAVSENLNAIDVASISSVIMGAVIENGSAIDEVDTSDSVFVGNVEETGNATDTCDIQTSDIFVSVSEILSAHDECDIFASTSIVESGNAADLTNAKITIEASVTEVGFVYDTADLARFDASITEILSAQDYTDIPGTAANETLSVIDDVEGFVDYAVLTSETLSASDLTDFTNAVFESLFTADFVSVTKIAGNNVIPGSGNVPGFSLQPNMCGIFGLVQTNSLFSTNIISDTQNALLTVSDAATQLDEIPQGVLNQVSLSVTTLQDDLTAITASLNAFLAHVQDHLANLIIKLNFATGQLAVQMGLVQSGGSLPSLGSLGTPGSNPCAIMDMYFGSIIGSGDSLLMSIIADMTATVSSIINLETQSTNLQSYADEITQNIGAAFTSSTSISTMVTAENAQYSSSGDDIGNITSTNTLLGFMTNPVSGSVIKANANASLTPLLVNTVNNPDFAGS